MLDRRDCLPHTLVPDTGVRQRDVMAPLTLKDAYRQARAHFKAGRHADAEQLCIAILRKAPNSHDTLLILGAIRVRQGRHNDALQAFDRARKALPSSANAWSNRGSALRSLGRRRSRNKL